MKRVSLFIVGILLVFLILWQADFYEVLEGLKDFSIPLLITTCLLQLITILTINFQWYKLAIQMGERIPLRKILHINLIGTFVESITPSNKAGGELTKVLLLRAKLSFSTSKATALVTLQKTISSTVFIFLNLIAIMWFLLTIKREGLHLQVLLIIFFCGVLILILAGLFILYPAKFYNLIAKIPISERIKGKIEDTIFMLRNNLKEIIENKKILWEQILLSLLIWILFPIKAYLIIKGLSIDISFVAAGVVTYLTYMVGMLPLLPGGVGTVEGSIVFFLLPMGVAASDGMAVALILRFVTFWFVFLLSACYMGYQELIKVVRSKRIAK
ncbi:flippase-like domain-containing protein [Natroniella acetigena]|nr:lysylphosphatidylglycerol synthase transmembrane domain-containing protein [Natroniella acetigena]MCK8826668.1 flippase-like domain-containing protein [Natroniella acetigena]